MRLTITINLDSGSYAKLSALLRGLEVWQQLGLLSDEQVRQLCKIYLSEPLPPVSTPVEERSPTYPSTISPTPTHPPGSPLPLRPPAIVNPPPGLTTRLLQSFMAEISVIWLLFLGVFLVVVSSGVLAANQWRNVTPAGQYGILFTYTLAFWGASMWTGQQERLRLTARMITIATLLIIPVNFWMMDQLKVMSSAIGIGVAAIATVVLTVLTLRLLRLTVGLPSSVHPRLTAINAIGLSWLHWGWNWGWNGTDVALIATYIGTVSTAFLLSYQLRISPTRRETAAPTQPSSMPQVLSLGTIAIACSTLLLLARAMFVALVPLHQLGLAFGLCGWLLCWLSRPTLNRVIWSRVGAGLLLWGWLISVWVAPPWQAVIISGLGLWLLWDQLKTNWRLWDLTALLLVGLQACWLLWFLLPLPWRQGILSLTTDWIGSPVSSWQLASIGGLIYVMLMIGLAWRLRQWQQPDLAQHTERMALLLGIVSLGLAWFTPLLRSLHLLLSTLILATVARYRTTGRFLVYLTHTVALGAVLSWIDSLFPNLSPIIGAAILLILMGLEWGLSLSSAHPLWQRSAWHLGFVLSGLAYPLCLSARIDASPSGSWLLMWLVTPTLLTLLANHPSAPHPRLAAWLTVPALLLQIPLLHTLTGSIITFGVAAVLMALNTRQLRQLAAALITVGFGLGFVSTWIWQTWADQLTDRLVLNLVAIALSLLWLARSWLLQQAGRLRRLYAIAIDIWTVAICTIHLVVLSLWVYSFYTPITVVYGEVALAAGLTTLAILYRLWQQPTDLGFCAAAWGLELGVAASVALVNPSVTSLAIATLALALGTQLTGDWWVSLSGQAYRSSWHAIPLTYGTLGLILSHSTFTASTGLYTLAAALVWIGVGRRHPTLHPLTYLSLFVVSIAAYELLIYQLLQAEGGNPGDGIALMAGLAALIAVVDRLLAHWLHPYLRLSPIGLHTIAHLHWMAGSGLLLLALVSSLSIPGSGVWIGVAGLLAAYGLVMGRDRERDGGTAEGQRGGEMESSSPRPVPSYVNAELWTYGGIWEAIAALSHALYRLVPDTPALLAWGGAIASLVAVVMYILPWENWGWFLRPWQRSATWLPGAVVVLAYWETALQTLLIVGAFYAWQAKAIGQVRLSYISVFLLDWAILRFLTSRTLLEPIWFSTVIGGSLLYVVEVDPGLQAPGDREKRHVLRILATTLICLTALYQAEVETQATAILFALLTLGLSIGLILAGLALRVRAFLYVGTATFIIQVLRLLWLFINTYPLLLWAIGIVLGLIFIWIAATFEARRSQVTVLVQYWIAELQEWE